MAFMHFSVQELVLRFSYRRRSEPPKQDVVKTSATVVRFVSKAPKVWHRMIEPPTTTVHISEEVWGLVWTDEERANYRKEFGIERKQTEKPDWLSRSSGG